MIGRKMMCCLATLTVAVSTTGPASAYTWPGEAASPGGALSALAIADACDGVVTDYERAEFKSYLAKARREFGTLAGVGVSGFDSFVERLSATYSKAFRDGRACDAGTSEEARDMLQRIRIALLSDAPLHPADDHPDYRPDLSAAIEARLTAERCRETLTAIDAADITLYIAKAWSRWTQRASETDARLTMDLYAQIERDIAANWTSTNCSPRAIAKTQRMLAAIRKP